MREFKRAANPQGLAAFLRPHSRTRFGGNQPQKWKSTTKDAEATEKENIFVLCVCPLWFQTTVSCVAEWGDEAL
jgi:hypothetical protein